jgi:hypothetical protein
MDNRFSFSESLKKELDGATYDKNKADEHRNHIIMQTLASRIEHLEQLYAINEMQIIELQTVIRGQYSKIEDLTIENDTLTKSLKKHNIKFKKDINGQF